MLHRGAHTRTHTFLFLSLSLSLCVSPPLSMLMWDVRDWGKLGAYGTYIDGLRPSIHETTGWNACRSLPNEKKVPVFEHRSQRVLFVKSNTGLLSRATFTTIIVSRPYSSPDLRMNSTYALLDSGRTSFLTLLANFEFSNKFQVPSTFMPHVSLKCSINLFLPWLRRSIWRRWPSYNHRSETPPSAFVPSGINNL